MSVGIVRHDIYLEHVNDDYHPESPSRLEHIYAALDEMGGEKLTSLAPRAATIDEIALVHEPAYVKIVANTEGRAHTRLDPDTAASARSYEAAVMAVGGVLELLDAIERGEVESGFALVRPPGHHAERSKAMGFCLFNNIAVGARYLQKTYGLKRILIVDFDLHHGNGTQHSFYRDPEILYFSTHQYPYYPGTGSIRETGEGEGAGFTVNVPLSYGMGDDDYEYVFRRLLAPLADRFHPEIVLVSAGFDTYYNDPLGGMAVTEYGFAAMTRALLDIAEEHCRGKIAYVLEGGYDVRGLAASVKAVIMELKREPIRGPHRDLSASREVIEVVEKVKGVLKPFWGEL
ncbi:MAG TPA: histone deacetylase [Syntrophorhabdaceae bacterium]|jgi:acetoin utilization deacetylase AcuC-like enzyme